MPRRGPRDLQQLAEALAGRVATQRLHIEAAIALLRPHACTHCARAAEELLEATRPT